MPPAKKPTSVAIVTRTKDRPLLLQRAMRSVLQQEHQDWTHIIVNDGGDKDAVNALAKEMKKHYAGRLVVLHHATSKGREAASNAGLKKCKDRYVVFLDDDDTWHPSFLRRCLGALQNSPVRGARGVACQTVRIEEILQSDGHTREIKRGLFNGWLRAVSIPRLCAQNYLPNLSLILEKSLIDEIGDFDEDLHVLGDWDFNLRVALAAEILVVPEALAYYHLRAEGRTSYSNSFYMYKDDLFKVSRAQVINKWIRLERKKPTGFSVAQAMAFAELNAEGHYFSSRANRIFRALSAWAE